MSTLLTSFLLLANVAAAGPLGTLCARALKIIRGPDAMERYLNARSDEARITHRFRATTKPTRLDWDVARGVLRVTFSPNAREYNDELLSVASLLALAWDGRVYFLRDSAGAPPRERRPTPHLRVGLIANGPEGMLETFTAPRDRAVALLATLEVSQAPVGEPSVSLFNGFPDLLHRADRFAFLMTRPEFRFLELHTTPDELRGLRVRLARLLRTHR